ncbi:MAG TPA: hypothetical protein PK929_18365 [Quisquiliibacterium sp.]|nr:hypothetical protein [Quisquiliibacterium sp.]
MSSVLAVMKAGQVLQQLLSVVGTRCRLPRDADRYRRDGDVARGGALIISAPAGDQLRP